jgi:hypothetical protein
MGSRSRLDVRYREWSLESKSSQSRFPFGSHSSLTTSACHQPYDRTLRILDLRCRENGTRARREARINQTTMRVT